jgi:hypothetical protein
MGWMQWVRFPRGEEIFSSLVRVQTSSWADAASYPVGTEECFPVGKGARCLKLNAHLPLMPKIIMRGLIPALRKASLLCVA